MLDRESLRLSKSSLSIRASATFRIGLLLLASFFAAPRLHAAVPANGLLHQVWSNLTGKLVTDLTSSAAYPNAPTTTDYLTLFEGPVAAADNYGSRIRGYIKAPTTGNYTFWIAADDVAELWLATNTDEGTKKLIAKVSAYTTSRQWTKYAEQQSVAIALTGGQKYYVEVLHKEG